MEKFLRIVVIKEIKGSQYGVQLESSVRDRLAADDKYEDEEEAALEKVVEFFQSKYLKKDSIITFHFPATSGTAEVKLISIISSWPCLSSIFFFLMSVPKSLRAPD